MMTVRAQSIEEVRDAVCTGVVLPVAGGSKPALWRGPGKKRLASTPL